MDPALLALPLLALADSTSIGTLVIPILMLLAPGPTPVLRLVTYLAIVAGLYFVIGIALLGAADAVAAVVASLDGAVGIVIEGAVGAALVAYAVRSQRRAGSPRPSRLREWRERTLDPRGPMAPLVTLAVIAVAVEAASMLPYIGGVALIARADLMWPASAALVLGYCLLMIVPAVVLMLVRSAAAERVQPWLMKIEVWSMKSTGSKLIPWAAGLAGLVLVVDAVLRALGA